MSSRLRSLDSKISFFAFADIITAVSGVLIFVALLLATDLGRPTNNSSATESSEINQRLQETLAQQAEVDAENHRLGELLSAADTAPDLETLQIDVAKLRIQLSAEQTKQMALADQMANGQAAIAARDKTLGLTGLQATVQEEELQATSVAQQEAKARSEMDNLEQQVVHKQSQLLKLRQREGQLWLIPDKSITSKEPILVTVSDAGVTIDRFDHPDQRRQSNNAGANSALKSYLGGANTLNQYVVFFVRPSGITLFQDLLKSARDMGFEVGFDALEENREIHFSPLPSIDESTPSTDTPATTQAQQSSASSGNSGTSMNAVPRATPNKPKSVVAPSTPLPPKDRSWWQKRLEWTGLG
jgi:hypothetical protein